MKRVTGWMLALTAAAASAGCGGPSNEEQCAKLSKALNVYRQKLGTCAATEVNQQPLSRPTEERCELGLADVCPGQGEHSIDNYVYCLEHLDTCAAETQQAFDDEVSECLRGFEVSRTDAECTEAVTGR